MDKDSKEKTAFTTFAGLYQISSKLTENTIHYFNFTVIHLYVPGTEFNTNGLKIRSTCCANPFYMLR